MKKTISAIATRGTAFVRGDMLTAEGLTDLPAVDRPAILDRVSVPDVLELLLETAARSAADADLALESIQAKATGLATLLVTILPLAFAGTAIAIERAEGPLMLGAVVAFLIGDGLLVVAAIVAWVAAGLACSGSVTIDGVDETGLHDRPVDNLRADIADARHFAFMIAVESGTRKARDLFVARRTAAVAFAWFLLAVVLVVVAMMAGLGLDNATMDSAKPLP